MLCVSSVNLPSGDSIGLVTGLLGALSAVVMLLWPRQVAEELFSYPLTAVGFYVAQGWFSVHHFGLVLVLVALALSGALGMGRFPPLCLAVIGMVALTFCELLAMRYADWSSDMANAGLLGTSYGISVTVIGLGMLAAGSCIARGCLAWMAAVDAPGHRDCHIRVGNPRHVRRLCHRAVGDRFLVAAVRRPGMESLCRVTAFHATLNASARHTAGPADDMTPTKQQRPNRAASGVTALTALASGLIGILANVYLVLST